MPGGVGGGTGDDPAYPIEETKRLEEVRAMDRRHQHTVEAASDKPEVIEVAIGNAHCGTEFAELERYLTSLPGVNQAHLDRTRGVAHLGFDPSKTSAQDIRRRLVDDGYVCDCRTCAGSRAQRGHPQVGSEQSLGVHDHAKMAESGHPPAHPIAHDKGHDAHAGHGADMVADLLR